MPTAASTVNSGAVNDGTATLSSPDQVPKPPLAAVHAQPVSSANAVAQDAAKRRPAR